MEVSSEQIAALKKLQHADTMVQRLQKELDELPQKQAILDVRHKKSELEQKRAVVEKALEDTSQKLQATLDEIAQAEASIDEKSSASTLSSSDFRSAEAAEKNLEAAYAHHEELTDMRKDLTSKREEAIALLDRINEIHMNLKEHEQSLMDSYRKKGGALSEAIEKKRIERASLAHVVGAAIMDSYERIAKAKGGVAVSQLNGDTCNICRTRFDQDRILKLRSEAPLSQCPSCGRLMLVDKRP